MRRRTFALHNTSDMARLRVTTKPKPKPAYTVLSNYSLPFRVDFDSDEDDYDDEEDDDDEEDGEILAELEAEADAEADRDAATDADGNANANAVADGYEHDGAEDGYGLERSRVKRRCKAERLNGACQSVVHQSDYNTNGSTVQTSLCECACERSGSTKLHGKTASNRTDADDEADADADAVADHDLDVAVAAASSAAVTRRKHFAYEWDCECEWDCEREHERELYKLRHRVSSKYLAAVQRLLRPYLTESESESPSELRRHCDGNETAGAQLVAQSIGQAFQVAYLEFLKANGIEEPTSPTDDVDYQEVLNSQEMFNEELRFFTSTDHQKDVLLPKAKGEPLGVVIVESGWGSVIPTVILANMHPRGAAARCGQLNIGDQIISVNGVSLVGLPLATCQNYIKNARSQTSVKLRVIGCPPVVEVLVRRPDPKYQLGFSVQNGVICSLLRGGIAERGGVRVGHRIIEINRQSMVAVPHEKIVQLLSSAVGEIHMRTMPTTIYRLLTGQETPHYI